MKKLLTRLLAIGGIGLLILPACKKDEKKAYATNVATSGLQASSSTIVLTKADLAKTAVTFNLTQADFGYAAAISNVLQIDAPDDNFAHPKEFNISGKTATQAFTTLDFNNLVLALNFPTGVASPLQARIKSSIGATVAPVYSNVVSLTVTPFALTAFVYVPGAYQGWNPAAADSLESATGNGVYTGVINFTGADMNFKITSNRDWNHTNYGDAGGGTVSSSGGNLVAPAGGNVKITVDLNANTIVMVPTQWSIIGDSTPGGWGGDTDMQFDNAHQMWVITANLTAGGNIKFRLNHDWGTNLGGAGGTLSLNGANIPIADAGTYKITLDVAANTYTLVKQ
ncbi:MAG TPA: SusE domain-containing protein [Mucilaginibacter sp.]|nr:SusE domain-containing protein [Mucilaginibacter sp.]